MTAYFVDPEHAVRALQNRVDKLLAQIRKLEAENEGLRDQIDQIYMTARDSQRKLMEEICELEHERDELRDQNEELWLLHYKLLLDGADDTTAPDGES